MNDKNSILQLKLSSEGLVVGILICIFAIFLGLYLICFTKQIMSFLIGLLFVIVFIYKLLDIWFFKRVVFRNHCVIKEWKVFGKIYFNKIKYKNLKVVIAKRGLVIKSFIFKNKKQNFFKRLFCFGVDLFLTKEEDIEKMKDILIEKKVLTVDEYGW